MPDPIILPITGLTSVIVTNTQAYDATPAFQTVAANTGNNTSVNNPVFADITWEGGSYTGTDSNTYSTPSLRFNCVLINLTQTKNIVKTKIQGSDNGTVKEYIGLGDWSVQIQATITSGTNGVYPTQDIADLYRIMKAPVAIPVTCWYLQKFDINHLVLEDITMAQEPGSYSQQKVTLHCWSDNTLNAFIS
jgi:hypothetical protein